MIRRNIARIIFFCLLLGVGIYSVYQYRRPPFSIDLVYLWVDGADEQWAAKKKYWQEKQGVTAPYAVHPARWRDREELKHSLRSIEKYMPWVDKIYIVTDEQIPDWLDTNHPKIKVIDHREILPKDALPVFNSMAIETGLANIPELSEHFIYLNDDVFINNPLTRDFFFTPDGKPIYYNDTKEGIHNQQLFESPKGKDSMWGQIIQNEINVIRKKIDPDFPYFDFIDTHTFTSYTKSTYQEAMQFFADEIKSTQYSKFRSTSDLSRNLVFAYQWKKGDVVVINADDVTKWGCKKSGLLIMSRIRDLDKYDPCTFCLNDYQNISDRVSQAHVNILHKKFPEKSSFEK